MTVREMHYDFKQKLNRIDSQKDRGLYVPEIDWKLNEAQEVFVKMVAVPRYSETVGFEIGQRTIDDIKNVVIEQKPADYMVATVWDDTSYLVQIPDTYWFLLNLNIMATKGECTNVLLYDSKMLQHGDLGESSVFNRSSFEWRMSNYKFNKDGLRIFTDGSYSIDKVGFEFLMKPSRIYNAADWESGTYIGLDGVTYTGRQDCKLSDETHKEIVDIAVLLTANDLNLPTYAYKKDKIKIVNN